MASPICNRCIRQASVISATHAGCPPPPQRTCLYPHRRSPLTSKCIAIISSPLTIRTYAAPSRAKPKLPKALKNPIKITTYSVNKKPFVRSGKSPDRGERKALRERIVLSNVNALEVKDLVDMDVENGLGLVAKRRTDGVEVEKVGEVNPLTDPEARMLGLKGELVDQLRAAAAFKKTQRWSMFRRPAVLVRREGRQLAEAMVESEIKTASNEGAKSGEKDTTGAAEAATGAKSASAADSRAPGSTLEEGAQNPATSTAIQSQAVRMIVDGERECGKSGILLYAMAVAFSRGWVVVHLPDAQEIVKAVTAYAPIEGTSPRLYSQRDYVAALLSRIAKSNATVLDKLPVIKEHKSTIPIQHKNVTLRQLCELGGSDPAVAWPVFQAFWTEITLPGRPPVLFSLDGLSHLMSLSSYRSVDYELVHTHDLALVKHFLDHLSGKDVLPNGGAVLGATSLSSTPKSPSLSLYIAQQLHRQGTAGKIERADRKRDPWCRTYDERADAVLHHVPSSAVKSLESSESSDSLDSSATAQDQQIQVLHIPGLHYAEAKAYMTYWARSGLFKRKIDEVSVGEVWSVAGHGLIGQMERVGLFMMGGEVNRGLTWRPKTHVNGVVQEGMSIEQARDIKKREMQLRL